MSSESLLIHKKATVSEESSWKPGTVTDGTKLLPLREDGISINLAPSFIKPGRIKGAASYERHDIGLLAPNVDLKTFGYPVGLVPLLLKGVLGQVTSTEQASFVVTTGANDKINFTEDGGAELTATLAAGTYAAGATSAVAGSLCKEIKDKLEAAAGSAGTYTVTYNYTTKVFAVSVSGGASVFVMKFSTGANAALSARTLLGYGAVDTASGATATAATATEIVFKHAITILDDITYGRSAGFTVQAALASGKVFDLMDCVIDSFHMEYAPPGELALDFHVEARKHQASSAALSALTAPTVAPLIHSQLTFEIDNVAKACRAASLDFSNNYAKDIFVNALYREKFVRNGHREVSGSFSFDITDSEAYTLFDAFVAGSTARLEFNFIGAVIKTAMTHRIDFRLPKVAYAFEAIPGGGGAQAPEGTVPFVALEDSSKEIEIDVWNNASTL